jgi:hypothetical protein
MAFAPFNAVLPVIAALAVFIFGYVALFVSLMICFFLCLVIAKGIYEGAKKVRTYAMRSALAKTFISSDVGLTSGLDSRSLTEIGGRS